MIDGILLTLGVVVVVGVIVLGWLMGRPPRR